jgi:hypothetical protein
LSNIEHSEGIGPTTVVRSSSQFNDTSHDSKFKLTLKNRGSETPGNVISQSWLRRASESGLDISACRGGGPAFSLALAFPLAWGPFLLVQGRFLVWFSVII